VIPIKIEFLLKFCSEEQLPVVTSMCLGEGGLQTEQKGQQLCRICEGLLEWSSLDVKGREVAMNMAATFAGLLVSAVETQHWGALEGLSLEIGTEIEGEGVVEGLMVGGRQLK
jgi:hypothetical protein